VSWKKYDATELNGRKLCVAPDREIDFLIQPDHLRYSSYSIVKKQLQSISVGLEITIGAPHNHQEEEGLQACLGL